MRRLSRRDLWRTALPAGFTLARDAAAELRAPYKEWRDPDTGRLVRRITPPSLPASGLYHHLRAFTPDGRWMVFRSSQPAGSDVYALNLETGVIVPLTTGGGVRLYGAVCGRAQALITTGSDYELLDIPGGGRRRVAPIPPDQTFATSPDTTAGGTHIVGTYLEMTEEARKISRSDRLWVLRVWGQHLKNTLFAIDLETGARKDFYHLYSWVDHLQCSPADPTLFTYVDQGRMQRSGNGVRVMRTDGSSREMVAEGGGHHIWSPDGVHIYYNDEYDHPAPWEYWRWNRRTGERERLLPREEWNFHFCVSPDLDHLVGDGNWSDPYINMYRLGGRGRFEKARLSKRITPSLRTEDQARFAPDGKSVFFNGSEDGIAAIFQIIL